MTAYLYQMLDQDCLYMVELTFWKWFVLIGVILATWSASLSNLIGSSVVYCRFIGSSPL